VLLVTLPHTPGIRDNKYTDWGYFNFLLETKIDLSVTPKAIDQLEDELYYFTAAIHEAAWESIRKLKKKTTRTKLPKRD
jgi:hypothetical protein